MIEIQPTTITLPDGTVLQVPVSPFPPDAIATSFDGNSETYFVYLPGDPLPS